MGGRIAEQIIYGDDGITTGAGSDLRKATEIAREMVIEQGMGKGLRDQVFHEDNGGLMFDKMTRERPYSDETAKLIDQEVYLKASLDGVYRYGTGCCADRRLEYAFTVGY